MATQTNNNNFLKSNLQTDLTNREYIKVSRPVVAVVVVVVVAFAGY